jgi:hypothetical protein
MGEGVDDGVPELTDFVVYDEYDLSNNNNSSSINEGHGQNYAYNEKHV